MEPVNAAMAGAAFTGADSTAALLQGAAAVLQKGQAHVIPPAELPRSR
jgi:hypothetical protein